MLKNKLRFFALTITTAMLLLIGSSLYSSTAFFSDQSMQYTQTFRVPDTTFKASVSWEASETPILDTSAFQTEFYTVRIKNVGNISMRFNIIVNNNLQTTTEIIRVGDTTDISLSYTTDSDYGFAQKVLDIEIVPVAIVDENGNEFPYKEGISEMLSLYCE